MQPSKPLNPGEIYFDKDLGIELVAVVSRGCSFPPRSTEPHEAERISCVYQGNCRTSNACVTLNPRLDIVYLPKLQYATFKLTQLVI